MRRRVALAALLLLALPAAATAAGAEAEGGHFWEQFWEWFNLALLVGVLVYLTRRPIQNYLAERRERIQASLQSSEQLLREAETRLAEWSARADRLESDAEELRRVARRRAEDERERILADAHRSAERIQRDAEAAIDREVRRARKILREEAADLAVELAEQRLRENVTAADRARLVEEFVSRVAARPGAGPGAR